MSSDTTTLTLSVPYRTRDLPGTGGVIKQFNEDFRVEEIPLYQPCGEGTHVYFVIEKEGHTTLQAIQLIAKALGRPKHDIGYAGLKDAHGITRQMFSIEHIEPQRIETLSFDRLRVLSISRHKNKLKLGHSAGNRFTIKIRDTVPDALSRAKTVVDELITHGLPNYFGIQRFGARGDNARIGQAVLRGDYDLAIAHILGRPGPHDRNDVLKARQAFEEGDYRRAVVHWPASFNEQRRICAVLARADGDAPRAWQAVNHTLRKLYVSSFQSELFNQVLARRMDQMHIVQSGDIAWKHVNGACFRVEDPSTEQPRCDAFEISPTGPLFGPRMTEASGNTGRDEISVLADSGVTRDHMRATYMTKLKGGRRPLRVPLKEVLVDAGNDQQGPFIKLRFALPPGAYATNVTREICKTVFTSAYSV